MTILNNKLISAIIGIVTVYVILHLLLLHSQIIFLEYPIEYRENADLFRAYLLSIGKNIFAYENFPGSYSQYGFLYPWLGSKLISYTGIHFYPLRILTALAILPLLGLFIWQATKAKLSPLHILLLCGIVYGSYLFHANNISAMPNTLGLALFGLSVLLPPLLRFNYLSLTASCVFAGLGFFTKIYFGIGAFYILIYLFVNKDWRSFRHMLVSLIFVITASVIVIIYFLPAFYETNIAQSARLATWQPDLIGIQTKFFIRFFFSLLVLFVFCKWFYPQSKIFTLKNPYLFGLVLSSLILVKMGANDGAMHLYFQHLLMPFLVPLSIQIISGSNKKDTILILLFLNLLYINRQDSKHNDLDSIAQSFHRIEIKTALLDPTAELLYNSPTSYFAIKQMKTPNEHGQMEYLFTSRGEAGAKYQAQMDSIHENINARKYHQIFIDEWQLEKMASLYECYKKSETFEIVMYKQINKTEMWIPSNHCTRP